MTLQIRWRGVTRSAALEQHVERRARFALDRFQGQVTAVRVWLADDNGPRRGVDKRCAVEVDGPVGRRRAEVVDSDLYAAADRAIGAAARSVARAADVARTATRPPARRLRRAAAESAH